MTLALALGVFSASISVGTIKASWLKDLIIAITLGDRVSCQKVTQSRE